MSHPTIIDTGKTASKIDYYNDDLSAPYFAKAEPYQTQAGCWDYNKVSIIERETNKEIGSYIRQYSAMYRTFHPFDLNGKWYALYSSDYTCTRIMSLPDCKDIGGEDGQTWGFCPVDFYVPQLSFIRSRHYDSCPRNSDGGNKPDYTVSCNCYSFRHKVNCPLGVPNPKVVNGGYEWDKCICKKEMEEFKKWKNRWVHPPRIHGFVAGCIWGDDSSMKIQYLDLSQADKGILKREERFGYICLPRNLNLCDAIILDADSKENGTDEYDLSIQIAHEEYFDFNTGKKKEY